MTALLDLPATVAWLGRLGYDAQGTAQLLALVAQHGSYRDRRIWLEADTAPGWYLVGTR